MESVRGVVRRAVNILSKQHQMGPKALAVNPQTSYGPEGRGFESLRAYQSHGNSLNFRGFILIFCTFSDCLILWQAVDPSRDPYQSMERKSLESTGEEIPHRIRCLLLHGGGDVGVGVEGESGAVVPQHCRKGFYVYTVLQGQDRKCVPEVVEAYPFQSCPFQYPLEHVQDAVRGHGAAEWRGEDVFVFLLSTPI